MPDSHRRKSGSIRKRNSGNASVSGKPQNRKSAAGGPQPRGTGGPTPRGAKNAGSSTVGKPKTTNARKPKTVNKPKTTRASGSGIRPKAVASKRQKPSSRSKSLPPGQMRRGSGSDSTRSSEARNAGGNRGGGGGGRKKKGTKLGLAMKFALPVGLLLFLIILLYALIIAKKAQGMLINEILKNGASGVNVLADKGLPMVQSHASQYGVTDKEWPVTLKLISQEKFLELAGKKAGTDFSTITEKDTQEVTKNGCFLRQFVSYQTRDSQGKPNEVLDAYILNFKKEFVAGAYKWTGQVDIQPENWLGSYVNLQEVELTGSRINLPNDVEITVVPGYIVRNNERHNVLTFYKPIFSGRSRIGQAVLAVSAESVKSQVSSLNLMLYGIGGAGVLLAIGMCILIATKVTQPVNILIRDMKIVAAGDLTHTTRAHSNDEIGEIATEFNQMTQALLLAHEKEKEAERLENELNIAREIQNKLLPARLPHVKGFDIHAVYKPAKEVGGDYYDFLPIGGDYLGIIVADVSGKGIPGSMVMATTRTILRFVALNNPSSAQTLTKTNAIVAADIKRGMFVTAFYLVIDVRKRQMTVSSAGHNPMVIMHADGTLDEINPSGIALGFDKGKVFSRTIKEQVIDLQKGDRIVLYTDGVVEAMNVRNEEYTDERFLKFVKSHNDLDSKTFIDELLADLERHKGKADQHDDITIVSFRVL